MVRQLMVMRHAKSSWAAAGLADFDRPLNERGQTDAPRQARWLARQRWIPDLILCSTANRTRETVKLLTQQWTEPVETIFRDDLYHGSASRYWTAGVEALLDNKRVLVVGHNPGMLNLVAKFQRSMDHFPTAAIAIFQELDPEAEESPSANYLDWRLLEFMAPKLLPLDES